MKALITGADGMLGSDFCDVLKERRHEVLAANRRLLDVTDLHAVRRVVTEFGPDVVLHAAAFTDVDAAEREPDIAYAINTVGTWNVALACAATRAQLVYVSSCGVFDGKKSTPYTELDAPNPLTHYHRSKLEGEAIVVSLVKEHFVLRPGWLFGGRAGQRRNFVAKRYEEALHADVISSAADRLGSPTYTRDFAAAALAIVQEQAFGLYHVANSISCTRHEFVTGCIAALRLSTKVLPVGSDCFPRSAPVPASEALDCYFLRLRGLAPLRTWREALTDYVHNRLLPELTVQRSSV